MATTSDETRFQKLPSDEEWEKFKEAVDKNLMKVIVIDKTFWHNSLTRCKGTVLNMPIIATSDSGNRPKAITSIQVYAYDDEGSSRIEQDWVFNHDYCHINICDSYDVSTISYRGDDGKLIKKYIVNSLSICGPITMHHLYTRDAKELKLIFTGQLQGQNSGSPFRRNHSVANNYHDGAITDTSGGFIKRTAPVLQLITKRTAFGLQDAIRSGEIRNVLAQIKLPSSENEIMVKKIDANSYTVVSLEEAEKLGEDKRLSAYYNSITYEQTKNIMDNMPKIELDVTCVGLGSAGTGILDQIGRGNWFQKYMLVDFDRVESKNLRNQWYTNGDITDTKTYASSNKLRNIKPSGTNLEIISVNKKFQEAGLDGFVSKYLISGFDSIECRLELLDYVKTGKTQAKYIIDTRYDDLDASIFFIDTSNKTEMEYYEKGLVSDKEAFDAMEPEHLVNNEEQFMQFLQDKGIYNMGCASLRREIAGTSTPCWDNMGDCSGACCKEGFRKLFREYTDSCIEYCDSHADGLRPESSCIKQNLIDIYKFASAFVFSAVRAIEDGSAKPFTHIEATTKDGMPASMVLRK